MWSYGGFLPKTRVIIITVSVLTLVLNDEMITKNTLVVGDEDILNHYTTAGLTVLLTHEIAAELILVVGLAVLLHDEFNVALPGIITKTTTTTNSVFGINLTTTA